jgi:acid phosphatase
MENKGYDQVAKLSSSQFLAQKGAVLTQSYALTHPSGPNYRLLAAGKKFTPQYIHNHPEPNVAASYDTIGIPSYNWHPKGKTALKHDPYRQIHPSITTWQRPFQPDLLPARCQVFLGLDHISNGHDPLLNVPQGLKQINATVTELLAALDGSKWFNTPDASGKYPVFLMTYDESFGADQHIYTALYGRGVKTGYSSSKRYDHLSVCRTMTDNWGLPPLGDSDRAEPIRDVWVTSTKASKTSRNSAAMAMQR